MGQIIKNGTVFYQGNLQQLDLLIEEGKIIEIDENLSSEQDEMLDMEGKIISPGFVDLHVHLREPGGEHKETIETGTKAAAKGGFTTIAPMPNTNPVPDTLEHLNKLQEKIDSDAVVRVLPYAALTKGLKGMERTNITELFEKGAFAFTDDGVGIQSAGMMFEAMQEAAKVGAPVVAHCEDNSLIMGGCVHDGSFARENDLPGIPSICEAVQIARDVLLAEKAGAHYHVCHVSTKESVRVIRDAKKAGIHVTAEVTPHHLLLNEKDIPSVDTNYKMNPPLREKADQDALFEGLMDGTLDFIATDHAPHASEEKAQDIRKAPFGIVGLETAFPLLYTHLVQTGKMSLEELLASMTSKPSETFSLPTGTIEVGKNADLVALDLKHKEAISAKEFESKGKNTPFDGWECQGWPMMTWYNGKIVYKKEGILQ